MVSTTKSVRGKFYAAPEFTVREAESVSGILEVRDAGEQVRLTVRESEYAAGVSIVVDREELEKALGKGESDQA